MRRELRYCGILFITTSTVEVPVLLGQYFVSTFLLLADLLAPSLRVLVVISSRFRVVALLSISASCLLRPKPSRLASSLMRSDRGKASPFDCFPRPSPSVQPMTFSILKPSLLASMWSGSSWAGAGASVGGFAAAFVGLRSKRDIIYIYMRSARAAASAAWWRRSCGVGRRWR